MAYPTVTEHHKRYPNTSVMASPYSCDNTGAVNCAAAIEQIKSDLSSSGTVVVPKGTYLINTNLTLPAGMLFRFEAGASFSVSTGKTLTVQCDLEFPDSQTCFSGAGTITLGTSFSANPQTLRIPRGTWTISTNTTVPSNVTLDIQRGAVFTIATGRTFTINGTINAGGYQIFNCVGTGKVVFASGPINKIYPEWWGATGDGTTDDSTAIQAALTCPVNSVRPLTVFFSSKSYAITSGLTIDVAYTSADFNATTIDASGMVSGTALTITATANDINAKTFIRSGYFEGPGKTSTVKGIAFLGTAANKAVTSCNFEHMRFSSFLVGYEYQDFTWVTQHYGNIADDCGTAVKMVSGGTTYGENIAWFGGQLVNCDTGVINQNAAGNIHFNGSSIDYCGVIADAQRGGIHFDNCHIEGNSVAVPYTDIPFQTSTNQDSVITVTGGRWTNAVTLNTTGITYCVDCDNTDSAGGVIFDGVLIYNTLTTTGKFASGVGRVLTKNLLVYYSGAGLTENDMLSDALTLLQDGGFEKATVDEVVIYADTAGITDRVNGANIDLTTSAVAKRTGAKSLCITKVGAGAARARLILPITDKTKHIGWSLYYAKPGVETGQIYIYGYYTQVQYFNQYGTPVVCKETSDYGDDPLFGAGAVTWTEIKKARSMCEYPPAWSTHYMIEFNLDGMDPGILYVDDVIITEI